jgi:hypothetical protein
MSDSAHPGWPGQPMGPGGEPSGAVPGGEPSWGQPGPAPGPPYGTPAGPWGGAQPTPPYLPVPAPAERFYRAWQERTRTDYIFNFWTALGWTLLTLGFYGLYVFYQLVRRMREHNARRLELLDSAVGFAWEEAGRRRLQGELAPSFQRAGSHLAVLKRMTGDFREPALWLVLSVLANVIVHVIAFVLLDGDLVKHDRAEVGVEYELALIYGRLGHALAYPDAGRVKRPHNYVGRIVAAFFSGGIYFLWWFYNMMVEPNRHFYANWSQEDALAAAITAAR